MSCFPELTYAIYADGELPEAEARQVETHLATCPRCRRLADALRAENQLLAEMVQEAGVEPQGVMARPARPLDILWTALAVLVAAVGLEGLFGWVSEASPPASVEWFNPLSLAGQLNLFFTALFYFIQEGVTMLQTNLTTVSVLVLGVLLVGGGVYWLRRRPATVAVLITLVLALGLALPGSALEQRKGGTITVPSGQTVDDTLIAHGESVNIDGVVTGNLIITSARHLTIRGTVRGDVICFAQMVDLDGTVGGNVFAFAQWLTLRGRVQQAFHGFIQNFRLEPAGRVDTDLIAFAQQVNLEGTVGRDATLFVAMADVRGTIGRNLTARTNSLTLLAPARVGGDLVVYVEKKREKDVHVDPGATVVGKTDIHVTAERRPSGLGRYSQPKFYLQQGLSLAVVFLLGLVLFWLFPALFPGRLDTASEVLRAAGVGFLALVAPPVAALILCIILLGIGLIAGVVLIAQLFPLLILVLWLLALYLAKVFVGAFLGQALLRPPAGQRAPLAVPLLAGLVIVVVALNVPYLGGLFRFLVWLLGLGIVVAQVRSYWRRPQPVA